MKWEPYEIVKYLFSASNMTQMIQTQDDEDLEQGATDDGQKLQITFPSPTPAKIKPESFQTYSEPPMQGCAQECHQEGFVCCPQDQGEDKGGIEVYTGSPEDREQLFQPPSLCPPRNCPRNPNFFHYVTVR